MEQGLGAQSSSRLGGPPRTGSARRDRLRRLSPPLWAVVAVVALLLSACQIRQEIRFNADGSGTASITVGIDKECLTGPLECSEKAKRLLGGEGPVAQAKVDAERLPFDVRVEPFESGPPKSAPEAGYTLSFDFASLEDLEQKLTLDPFSRSQTSALDISGMTFEENRVGGFTFTAHVSVPEGGPHTSADHVSFAVVLPGRESEHNATEAEGAEGATRFQWNYEAGEATTTRLQASTCSGDSCPGSSTPIMVVVAVALMAAVVVAFVLMRKERDERSRRGPRHVA